MKPYPKFADNGGLLPAIAQDATSGQVLMMAWMNQESFDETLQSGFATYFSRSRNRLWRKGEESGHRQKIESIHIDCDEDCILLKVHQTGAACHEGFASCFFRRWNGTQWVEDESRIVDPTSVYQRRS